MLIIPQAGARLMLEQLLELPVQWLSLYQNDLTPGQASVFGDFTECTFSGYVQQFIAGTWSPSITEDGHAKSLATQCNFVHDGGGVSNLVYGYFISDNTNLFWAERFPGGPINMAAGSAPLLLIPVLTFISEVLG